ncbi:MAG TPA: 3-deoxy-D-manno-octulosonic acid kinase [Pusillimonas sp.]|jgi:3-deoxy-D-manno-octulosonic acid kinase|uniref:3-deoxy-D-manno-octulosonic acid kinase n=1 Tax=unclassified Pusillimonas TaxID=2640016 RepID=UPI002624DBEF|nr:MULTISPECIES: 3-deoxy-D-manno-octulosonic acid kinase [unclassified Pusillimonas]HLU20094.1 3-deoxy-D-manno-octulosonic acid kinase [Pusillimonas sp.]
MITGNRIRTAILDIPGGAMCFDSSRIQSPSDQLFNPGNPQLEATSVQVGGRQSAWFVRAEFGSAVLRHYRRGGMIARISRDRYIWTGASSTRSFAEFRILQELHSLGVKVPAPLAAAYWRSGPFYRAAILIERIQGVRTLAEAPAHPHAVARAIHAMHRAGIWHADLNAYNVLLDQTGQVWLIDFDRARRRTMSTSLRQANLLRLRRSLLKVAGQNGAQYWSQVQQAYEQIAADYR